MSAAPSPSPGTRAEDDAPDNSTEAGHHWTLLDGPVDLAIRSRIERLRSRHVHPWVHNRSSCAPMGVVDRPNEGL